MSSVLLFVTQYPCGLILLIMLSLIAVFHTVGIWRVGLDTRRVPMLLSRASDYAHLLSGFLPVYRPQTRPRSPESGQTFHLLNGRKNFERFRWQGSPPFESAWSLQIESTTAMLPLLILLAARIRSPVLMVSLSTSPSYVSSPRRAVLVNVADLPTYFAFNPLLRRSIDRTPVVYTSLGQPQRFFSRIPLLEELAVQTWNCESLGQLQFQLCCRFRILRPATGPADSYPPCQHRSR